MHVCTSVLMLTRGRCTSYGCSGDLFLLGGGEERKTRRLRFKRLAGIDIAVGRFRVTYAKSFHSALQGGLPLNSNFHENSLSTVII